MKEKLTNNWGLKLISVCLAVFMWLPVINVTHPVEKRTVIVRNIKYLNENVITDSGKTYSMEDGLESKGIAVTVPVLKDQANKVKGDDFQIVVDLAKIGPYGSVEVDVEWPESKADGYQIDKDDITWKTTSVMITLEDIMTKSYPVHMKINGEPAESYIIGEDKKTFPRVVTIKAPQSVMEKIRSAGIEVDVSDMNSELTGTADLKLYDVSGEELKLDYDSFEDFEFAISDKTIEYTIPLLKTREVKLLFEGTSGTVADGYRYTEILGATQTVHVAGLRAVLADYDAIMIPKELLNLEGATGNVEVKIDTSKYVPDGVTIEGDPIVTVTLVVEPLIQQTRKLMPELIHMEDTREGRNYTIRGSVDVILEGLEEDLNALTDEQPEAWLSVKDMQQGSNTAEVHLTVDEEAFTLIHIGEATVTMEAIPETKPGIGESTAESSSAAANESGTAAGSTGSSAAGTTEEATTTAPESSGAGRSTE